MTASRKKVSKAPIMRSKFGAVATCPALSVLLHESPAAYDLYYGFLQDAGLEREIRGEGMRADSITLGCTESGLAGL